MQSLNKLMDGMDIFKESMSDNKKKAMIIGTYHLFLEMGTDESRLEDVKNRMIKFATEAPTEVRFELDLGYPGVYANLVDAWLHAELRKKVKRSKGLDTDISDILVKLQTIVGELQSITMDVASTLGLGYEDIATAQHSLLSEQLMNDILDSINSQDFTEVDKQLQNNKKIQVAAQMAMENYGKKYNDALIGDDLINTYDSTIAKANKVITSRDRRWALPTSDRVLICVGYEHIKFVKDVYREKGYTILK